jgi:hypothetical protein
MGVKGTAEGVEHVGVVVVEDHRLRAEGISELASLGKVGLGERRVVRADVGDVGLQSFPHVLLRRGACGAVDGFPGVGVAKHLAEAEVGVHAGSSP